MKSKKKRGNRRKKKAADLEPQNRHIRHERIGNMNYYGEEIARWFVEKLISLTITTSQTNRVYSFTNEICFNHCYKEISQYLLSHFLTHDKDELAFPEMHNPKAIIENFNNSIPSIPIKKEYEDDSNQRISQMVKDDFDKSDRLVTEMYYESYWERNNFWGDIAMPKTTVKERFAYTQVNVDKYEPIIIEKENEKKQQQPLPHVKPSGIKRMVSKKDFDLALGGITSYNENKNDDGNNKGDDIQNQGTKKKFVMINLPSYDLPPGKIPEKNNELPNIMELRKERIDLIKMKEDEERKRIQLEQHEKEVQKHLRNPNKDKYTVKMFPSNVTTDINGKVVLIRSFPIDSLSQEFIYGKSNEKDYKQLRGGSNIDNNMRKGKRRLTKQQGQILKKEEIAYNPVWNEIVEKYARRISQQQLQQTLQKEGNVTGVKSQSVNKKENAKSSGKHELSPSGSNFDLFVPEIGVTILEEQKKKTGGKDFFKKYNKISVHNFNQTLKETLKLNEIVQNSNDVGGKNNSTEEINILKDLKKRSRRNSRIIEPLEQNETTYEKEEETNTFLSNVGAQNKTSLNFNNSRLSPHKGPLSNMNIKSNLSNENTMQMTNYKFSSVRMAMANLDLLSEADEAQLYEEHENTKENKDNLRTSNIFLYKNIKPPKTKEFLSRNNSQRNLNDINKFTNTILSHSNWGSVNSVSTVRNINPKAKPKIHTKPLERDIEKEMGLGITMRKLPRSRMKKAAENVLMGYNRTGNHFRNGSISLRKSLSQAAIFTNRKHYNKLEEEE